MKHIPHPSSLNSEAFSQCNVCVPVEGGKKKIWEVASALYSGVVRGNKHWHNWFIILLKCKTCRFFTSLPLFSSKLNIKFSLLWLFLHFWSASLKKCTIISRNIRTRQQIPPKHSVFKEITMIAACERIKGAITRFLIIKAGIHIKK